MLPNPLRCRAPNFINVSGLDVLAFPALRNNSHRLTRAEQLTQHDPFVAGGKARCPAHTRTVINTANTHNSNCNGGITVVELEVTAHFKQKQRIFDAATEKRHLASQGSKIAPAPEAVLDTRTVAKIQRIEPLVFLKQSRYQIVCIGMLEMAQVGSKGLPQADRNIAVDVYFKPQSTVYPML